MPFVVGYQALVPVEFLPLTQYHLVFPELIVVSKNGEDTPVKSGLALTDGAASIAVFQNIS